ncbi:hypothetical protein [Desulfospira joergensenii]|uniref:hypothetical protein n=1 Tax=Desulfospira joergensenii TaxID=53329 RepID=UPI00048A2700|nr:hypothetical protein [Desulfospira joergensenii]
MKLFLIHICLPGMLILALPLAGMILAGNSWAGYLAFPPKPVVISHAPFSPLVFTITALFILSVLYPFVKKALDFESPGRKRLNYPFPGWGTGASAGLVLFWILAWTRRDWFSPFQAHTFFPLWFCLILVINGMVYKRQGTCPLENLKFFVLFPVSALFWWTFEYLNRFVGNWSYTGSQYAAFQYFLLATLSFSTVLPAVESVRAYLLSFDLFKRGFRKGLPLKSLDSPAIGLCLLVLSGSVLIFLGIFPDLLFPFVWISPLGMILGFLILGGRTHVLTPVRSGDFTPVVAYGLAALVCGGFWEMFNMYSLARWEYSVPFVQAFHLFEMPLLGYAGYLPFGLECGVIIHIILEKNET